MPSPTNEPDKLPSEMATATEAEEEEEEGDAVGGGRIVGAGGESGARVSWVLILARKNR